LSGRIFPEKNGRNIFLFPADLTEPVQIPFSNPLPAGQVAHAALFHRAAVQKLAGLSGEICPSRDYSAALYPRIRVCWTEANNGRDSVMF